MSRAIDLLKLAFQLSRFRFWFYITGPFTVGCIWAANSWMQLWTIDFFLYFFYFLFPANILLYGVNDLYDAETDRLNPKKGTKEYLINDKDTKNIWSILWVILLLSLVLVLRMTDNVERLIFGSFIFLSWFYSSKPIRFKAMPFLDSASNILFALPGIFAYYQVSRNLPPPLIIVAAFAHTTAMHLFSAIPDIKPDKEVKLNTTAVTLGTKKSLIACFLLWTLLSAITISQSSGSILSYLTLIYPIMPLALLFTKTKTEQVYWYYPYINITLGGILFISGGIQIPFQT
ncbi:prenyltransferase [Candidatus Bathyarchaeota archaeon]|nr:prenyltransferase [Candidatus Bathyarchaeota archaeon]